MLRVEYNQIIPLSAGNPPNAVCFNPHKPHIAIGINNQVEEHNIFTRARTNRTRIASGKITHILFSQTHSYKVVFTDDGTLYVWEEDTNILTTRKAIKKSVACCAVSNLLPFLFYAKSGSKEISMFDLAGNRACGKLDAKKSVTMCATHPSKHLLVTAGSDNSIRVIDYQAQRIIHTLEDFNKVTNNTTSVITSLCFHPSLNYILASGTSGVILIWGDNSNDPTAPLQLISKVTMTTDPVSIGFHPWLPFFSVLFSSGDVSFYIVEKSDTNYLQNCSIIKSFNLLETEKSCQTLYLPDYAKHQFKFQLKPLSLLFHPNYNLLTFNYIYSLPVGGTVPNKLSIGQVIYSLFDSFDPLSIQYSAVSKYQFPRSHWLNPDITRDYTFPNKVYFINNQKLRVYSVSANETSVLSNLPATEENKIRLYPVKLLHCETYGLLIVLFHYLVTNKRDKVLEKRLGIIRIKDPSKISFLDLDCRDILLSNDHLYVLHESQDKISRFNLKDPDCTILESKALPFKVHRIFETPVASQLLYYNVTLKTLYISEDLSGILPYSFHSNEIITQIQCQDHPTLDYVIAVSTTSQIFILSPKLETISSHKFTSYAVTPYIHSIMWLASSLLVITSNTMHYMTIQGEVHHLMSLSIPYCTLTMSLNDRFILSFMKQQNIELRSVAVGTLEPLLMGELGIKSIQLPVIQKIVSLHDKVRISVNLIKKLDSEGFSDLAFCLMENLATPQIPYQIKYKIAIRAQKFEKAFEVLLIEKKSCYNKNELNSYIKELSEICMSYGQIEIVKECYELLEDLYSLLNLYIISGYTQGIQSLLERAKRDGNNPLLLAACQRQLESATTDGDLVNWPLQSDVEMRKWITTDFTAATMATNTIEGASVAIKPITLDDIKKYFPLDVTVKTIKSASSKILLHRTSKKIRTKTKLEPLKPELVTASYSAPSIPTPAKPLQRKPITIATSTATIRKPLDDLLSPVPPKLPKLESISESPTTTPRESTEVSPTELEALQLNASPSTAPKPVRPPRPSSAAFTMIATTDMSPIVPASSLELDVNIQTPVTVNAAEVASLAMKAALPKLEKGLFLQSLADVDTALAVLVESEDPNKYTIEIKYCIAYKLALGLLMDVKKLEKEPTSTEMLARIGIRTKYLADLPLEAKHRVVCMRMAINKNIEAGNYGIASRLLEILIPKNLPDKVKLEEKLKICKQNFGADGNTPAFICPSCSSEVSAGIVACSCGRKIKFCFKTFELLTEPVYYSCGFCTSPFSVNAVTNESACELCKYGKLVKIE